MPGSALGKDLPRGYVQKEVSHGEDNRLDRSGTLLLNPHIDVQEECPRVYGLTATSHALGRASKESL